MSTFFTQFAMEARLYVRSKDGLFWTLLFPVFFIILFGLIYGDTNWNGIRAIDYILPGIVVMALMVTGIMYTAQAFVEDRSKGIYRRLSLTPLSKHVILGAQLANRYLLIVAQAALLLVAGYFLFNTNIIGNMFFFIIVLSLGALCFLSIGFALTAFIRSSSSANAITMIVFFMLMFLGGVFFPVDIMPGLISHIANALPSTHLGDALRGVIIQGQSLADVWVNLAVVAGWTLVTFAIAVRAFRWE